MINEQLNTLKTNIENTKDKLYTNLSNKGVTTITTASTLDEMADSVNNITVGGSSGDGNLFESLGYTATPQYILDGIEYAQSIKDNWEVIEYGILDFSNYTQLIFFPLVDTSTFRSIKFTGCNNLQYVPPLNTSNITSMYNMFNSCYGLKYLDLSSFDTTNVTSMSNMFNSCSSLTSVDISSFDTSNVTSMDYMFNECGILTSLDLSSFNTSNVTKMQYMFYRCSGLTSLDLSDWDTSNVTIINNMFQSCSRFTEFVLSSFSVEFAQAGKFFLWQA